MAKATLLIVCLFLVTSTLALEDLLYKKDPQQRLQECKHECRQQRQGQSQKQKCMQQCEREYRQGSNIEEAKEEEKVVVRSEKSPYVFEQESFVHAVRSEQGSIRILPNFIRRSKLLLGLANHRLAILEAAPNTFVVPNHLDADAVFYVVSGEGTVALIRGENRESWNVRKGEVIKVSAGTVVYLINRSSNKRLQIVKLLHPVSTPGQFEVFPTVGGDEPQSYYRVFSTEILEAALNTRGERLERLFGQQRRGVIVKATQEQIRSLSRHSSSSSHGSVWPFGTESSSTYNIFNKRATCSNRHGHLHEVDVKDYRPLKNLDVQVTYANITRGSMMVPFFNTRATKVAYVTKGRGYFEMVCPHLSQQKQQEREGEEEDAQKGGKFQKVESRLRKGMVFLVPAGHPVAIVAGKDENLEVVCFEVNAKGNRKTFVAGKKNVVSLMEDEAKELAFGVPSKLVDEVFEKGQEEVFVRGPEWGERKESERGEKGSNFESFLEFAGF